jgi:soluble lytic murein transglycosylase
MGNPLSALLAYNGGMGRVRRWREGAPELPADLLVETVEFAETREYVRKVAGAAAVYGFLYYGLTMEAVIADMLE